MSENDLDLVRRGLLIENHFGWQDWNDLATKTTPITLTQNVWGSLTNDGEGPYTNLSESVVYRGNIWDTSTNSFDFSDLRIGDLVMFRLTAYVTTHNSNVGVSGKLTAAQGSPSEYDVPFFNGIVKTAGRNLFSATTFLYIGNTDTMEYPCKVMAFSDAAGTEVEVEGWAVATFTRD